MKGIRVIALSLQRGEQMEMEVRNLVKTYVKKKNRIEVLKNFNYTFTGRNIYLVKGRSGVGKSTLLSILALMDDCDSGEIIYNGKDITKLQKGEKADFRYHNIGYVFQEYNLFSALTVEENVMMAFAEDKVKQKESDQIDAILRKIGLHERKHHKASELSGGEMQRAAIARAFVKKPSILICDEPVSNLDEDNTNEIKKILSSYVQQNDVICIISCHGNVMDEIASNIITLK